jgi:hypothetical protein
MFPLLVFIVSLAVNLSSGVKSEIVEMALSSEKVNIRVQASHTGG